MLKANLSDIPEEKSGSPSGKFCTIDKPLMPSIGADFRSMDLMKRGPFDVEMSTIPPGAANYPFHCHSNMFEFYIILSGNPIVRHKDGETQAAAGDFFLFKPGEPHQMINRTAENVTYYCVADNPINDHVYYPDSDKYMVRLPTPRQVLKGSQVDYYAGEEL